MSLPFYRSHPATMRADRHSCLAAPYSPTDPRTAKFFELNISKANAPVVCASAGRLKGKAIYADADLPKNTTIWTEAPYVAMQHELNKRVVPCCQYCFVPLLADYNDQWRAMAAQYNQTKTNLGRTTAPATPQDLDNVLQKLHVQRRHCGLAAAAIRCACGDAYCSKLCQMRAYHEFHAILCPREDPFSAMNVLVRHARETNDIFLLVAKVIARVLSRFLVTRDLVKAREPMDMFHKKPWWEVVMVEKHVQRKSSHPHSQGSNSSTDGSSGGEEPDASTTFGETTSPPIKTGKRPRSNDDHQTNHDQHEEDDDDGDQTSAQSLSPDSEQRLQSMNDESRFLKDLLVSTHQLLLDALESNLVHLAREDQLHGFTVHELWTHCASILSFEFFAAQLGLFEMNNIRVEIDHPFHALIDILEDQREGSAEDQELYARVRAVLECAAEQRVRDQLQALARDGTAPSGSTAEEILESGLLRGFPSFDGTALFSIICTMNHSCDPNCTVLYTKNGDGHVVAVRDIHKGEELCICYIDVDQDVLQREELLKDYQFRCICPRCIFERRQLKEQQNGGSIGTIRTDT